MAWTPVENAILSRLAYYGGEEGQLMPEVGDSLHSVLTSPGVKEYLSKTLGSSYHEKIDQLIDKVKDKDYSIAGVADHKKSGFAALAIKDPENCTTVVARGTQGFKLNWESLKDVDNDIQLSDLLETDQQKQMRLFMEELEKKDCDGYYFTGHSLGGNLSSYAAITSVPADKVKGVTTFNSPGFNEGFSAKYADNIKQIADRITNYQNKYDFVSSMLYVPGQVRIVESAYTGEKSRGFIDHYESMLLMCGDDFVLSEPQKKAVRTELLRILVNGGRIMVGSTYLSLLLGIMEMAALYGRNAKYGKVEARFSKLSGAKQEAGTKGKRKFSPLSLAIFGGMALFTIINYFIASPSGPFEILGWIVSVLIPYGLMFGLLRIRTPLAKWMRSKAGGCVLTFLFVICSVLVPILFIWLSMFFLIAFGLLFLTTVTKAMPNLYVVSLEDADGSVRTETHVLGDNPEQDIAFIDSGYESQGYTKK